MTHSMTAFARVQIQLDEITLCWEIKSVNHRYLDVSFRLPEAWRFLENDLRSQLRNTIHRGKLECQLKVQENNLAHAHISINEPLIDSIISLTNKLAVSKNLQNDVTLSTLLSWPDVISKAQPQIEQFAEPAVKLFNNAVQQLKTARSNEGDALEKFIDERLQNLQKEITKAKALVASTSLQTRDKLLTRLHSFQLDVDSTRVEQEIAMILTKLDVNEELDRLATHTLEVGKVLKDKGSTGRRLDFLMQELNREANTLSSKSDSVELTRNAVEMKVLIEQMREQIQNIE